MNRPFDSSSVNSIVSYAKKLKNKSLRQACGSEIEKNDFKGKGKFGNILEKFYFGYEPNSNSEPDFLKASLELKSSPLKTLKNGDFRSKERLVLNIINYLEVHKEKFEESSFWKKNRHLLIIFYLHDKEKDLLDYLIKLVDDWKYPDQDLIIIKKDWELINKKIEEGKAHELSEGDTFYLGACTKGSTAVKSLTKQPNSEIRAKRRAYCLKQGYVNHIIASIAQDEKVKFGKILKHSEILSKYETLEDFIISKIEPYYKMADKEIEHKLKINIKQSYRYYPSLVGAMLGIEINQKIEEFEKADIEIKAIRVEGDNNIKESVSFPSFEFKKIYNTNWDNSEFKSITEKKFLFVFFKKKNEKYFLEKAKFWNMPPEDRRESRRIWLSTKRVIQKGIIFKDYARDKKGLIRYSKKGNPIKKNNFPKIKDSKVCHVRPHGSDSNNTLPLPVKDKTLNTMEYSKQCFWLNAKYVKEKIYSS